MTTPRKNDKLLELDIEKLKSDDDYGVMSKSGAAFALLIFWSLGLLLGIIIGMLIG